MAASLGLAVAHDHPVRPRLETRRIPEGVEIAPHGDERLLDGVIRGIEVAEDAARDQVEPRRGIAREALVRLAIACLSPLHQCDVHSPRPARPSG